MRKLITAIALAATIGTGVTIASLPASASVNWKAQTCTAAAAYASHPTPAGLTALVTGSTRLGRSYLKADVGQLYADASSPSKKAARYVAKDEQYVSEDCPAGAATMAADVTTAAVPRTLPRWAHWKTAPHGACGHGSTAIAGIVVWTTREGDAVLICSDGGSLPN